MTTKNVSPNQVLIARAGTTTAHTVARILATYDRATADDIAAGHEWYDRARAVAAELAIDGAGSIERGAAILAHYSPRTSWTRNVLAARHFVATGNKHYAAMGQNHEGAKRAIVAIDPLSTLNGPKVRSFARNIVGDEDAVTVDVWAARVALGQRDDVDKVIGRVGVYDAIARAYRIAAERRGVSPAVMQAVTWVVARGRAS